MTKNSGLVVNGSFNHIQEDNLIIQGSFNQIEGNNCQVFGNFNKIMGQHCVVQGNYNKSYTTKVTMKGSGNKIYDGKELTGESVSKVNTYDPKPIIITGSIGSVFGNSTTMQSFHACTISRQSFKFGVKTLTLLNLTPKLMTDFGQKFILTWDNQTLEYNKEQMRYNDEEVNIEALFQVYEETTNLEIEWADFIIFIPLRKNKVNHEPQKKRDQDNKQLKRSLISKDGGRASCCSCQ